MKIFGIVGFSGVGKSTVAKILEQRGFFYINLDEIVHKLYEPNALGTQKIEAFFGPDFLQKDGAVNRKKLRKTVFNNEQKLRILEMFIHPLVLHEVKEILNQIKNDLVCIEITVYRRDAKINDLISKWILVKNSRANLGTENLHQFHSDLEFLKPDFVVENEGEINDIEESMKKIVLLSSV